ncbi:MAG: hypothetical protein J6N19_14345 [Clostridium sp.]|nr:hypothetical protein [Clostridium sp.]
MTREELKAMVAGIDPVNAEYAMKDSDILEEAEWHQKYVDEGRPDMAGFVMERLNEKIREFGQRRLLPSNAKVGDGATVVYWTDREAGTIVKVTRKTITIQRDKATLSPDFVPEFIPGGFAGTVINQHEQEYTYERDPNGRKMTFHWSEKYQTYGQPGNLRAIKGRHEFYDYNF